MGNLVFTYLLKAICVIYTNDIQNHIWTTIIGMIIIIVIVWNLDIILMNPFFQLRLPFQQFRIFFTMIINFETIVQFQKFYLIWGIHFGIGYKQTKGKRRGKIIKNRGNTRSSNCVLYSTGCFSPKKFRKIDFHDFFLRICYKFKKYI